MSIGGVLLDDMILQLLIQYTAAMDAGEVEQVWPQEAELRLVEEKIASTMQAFTSGSLPGSVAFPLLSGLEQQREDMAKDRTRWLGGVGGPVLGGLTQQDWSEMGLDARRAVAGRLLEAVMIRPATKGRVFDPERVAVVWRQR